MKLQTTNEHKWYGYTVDGYVISWFIFLHFIQKVCLKTLLLNVWRLEFRSCSLVEVEAALYIQTGFSLHIPLTHFATPRSLTGVQSHTHPSSRSLFGNFWWGTYVFLMVGRGKSDGADPLIHTIKKKNPHVYYFLNRKFRMDLTMW